MALVDSQLHLFPVARKVAPSYADMALQFRLGRAPEGLYPVNGSAVTVGEHLCIQHQAVAITVSEQPGIAPEFIRINRTPRRHHHPPHIGHCSGVHTPAAASRPQTKRIGLAKLNPKDGFRLPQSSH